MFIPSACTSFKGQGTCTKIFQAQSKMHLIQEPGFLGVPQAKFLLLIQAYRIKGCATSVLPTNLHGIYYVMAIERLLVRVEEIIVTSFLSLYYDEDYTCPPVPACSLGWTRRQRAAWCSVQPDAAHWASGAEEVAVRAAHIRSGNWEARYTLHRYMLHTAPRTEARGHWVMKLWNGATDVGRVFGRVLTTH